MLAFSLFAVCFFCTWVVCFGSAGFCVEDGLTNFVLSAFFFLAGSSSLDSLEDEDEDDETGLGLAGRFFLGSRGGSLGVYLWLSVIIFHWWDR